jgi:biopolymer transport protein ExbD
MIEFDEHRSGKKGIDLTPMIDVVFLLLIFFLLTSIFGRVSLPVNLPQSGSTMTPDQRAVRVLVDREGNVQYSGKTVSTGELRNVLEQLPKDDRDLGIQLLSDRGVPFGRVVEVMDAVKKAGIERITVLADRKR